jgi:hypothetical protein
LRSFEAIERRKIYEGFQANLMTTPLKKSFYLPVYCARLPGTWYHAKVDKGVEE